MCDDQKVERVCRKMVSIYRSRCQQGNKDASPSSSAFKSSIQVTFHNPRKLHSTIPAIRICQYVIFRWININMICISILVYGILSTCSDVFTSQKFCKLKKTNFRQYIFLELGNAPDMSSGKGV